MLAVLLHCPLAWMCSPECTSARADGQDISVSKAKRAISDHKKAISCEAQMSANSASRRHKT